MCHMEQQMQQHMEAGFALNEAVEEAAYRALMRHLDVLHVTITNGLDIYGISQRDTQAIVDEVAEAFGFTLQPVELKEDNLQSFQELMSFFERGV